MYYALCPFWGNLTVGFFPLVLLLLVLLGIEQVLDLGDKAISLLLETGLPGERATRTRSGSGRW